MGACFSSHQASDYSSHHQKPAANVVLHTGELRRYALPVTVAQVIDQSQRDSFFLCHSDRLSFDDYIPSMDLKDELEPSQIYFLLPISKLKYRLAASDMAALAVKASVALDQINDSNRRRRRKTRISPVYAAADDGYRQSGTHTVGQNIKMKSSSVNRNISSAAAGLGVSRSGSVRKLSRYSSRRAKLAVRSFRIKLTTIYEGSVLHQLA